MKAAFAVLNSIRLINDIYEKNSRCISRTVEVAVIPFVHQFITFMHMQQDITATGSRFQASKNLLKITKQ